MPLSAGTELGTHKILALIGVGGMGEVYKAHDTKLRRDIAIKVLPESFARDADRLARFRREAQLLASLNHPNIATIYNIEESNKTTYLVMELVPGETLADRIKREGAVPVEEALTIAKQIAEALEAAHEKGIIHRDLKPANVKLMPDGKVKVLDFGLAKAFSGENSTEDMGNSPTLSMAATMQGVILGTAAYMSPEQARGKSVDKRTDIWAFGAVLCELLTGKPLFQCEDVGETIAAVIMKDPDLSAAPAQVLPLLKRCLEKNPKKRLRDIGDMELLLATASAASAPVSSTSARSGSMAWGIAALAMIFALGISLLHFREPHPEVQSLRFQIPPPEGAFDPFGMESVVSPDGRHVIFAAPGDGSGPLILRPLNSLITEPLPGSEGAYFPFWSPDSKSVGFFAGGKLKRIDIAGGPPIILADVGSQVGGAWGSDVILFAPAISSPLMRIPAGGGTASPATHLRPNEASHRFPSFLPDGRHFLYLVSQEASHTIHSFLHIGDTSSAEDSVIGESDSTGIYSQGFLLFSRQGTLLAQPFDPQRRVTMGSAVPLEQGIMGNGGLFAGFTTFSASTNGLHIFHPSVASGVSQLTWVDRTGKLLGHLGNPGNIRDMKFSPDYKHAVATLGPSVNQKSSLLWIFDTVSNQSTRFTFDSSFYSDAVWSPDGRTIIYASRKKQNIDLYRKAADGSGNEELVFSDSQQKTPSHISDDGKFLLYRVVGTRTGDDIWVVELTPEKPGAPFKTYPFAQTPADEDDGQFAPGGRWIAYNSNESQRNEVYVAHFPDGAGKRQVSVNGGNTPRWRKDGKEIFFVASDGKVMSAPVVLKGEAIQIGEVRPLFTPPAGINIDTYEVTPDGQRFLLLPVQEPLNKGVTMVVNWAERLKK